MYIQGIAGDIQAHERAYEELCSKCRELVVRASHDVEKQQQKLDKFKQRWNTLQVRQQRRVVVKLRRHLVTLGLVLTVAMVAVFQTASRL